MRTHNQFWWFVALALFITATTFIVLTIFFWNDLAPAEKKQILSIIVNHPTFFFMTVILVIAAVGFALDGALHSYILPLNRMLEGSRIVLSANPSHRLKVDGSRTVQALADLFNSMAARIETTTEQIAAQVEAAREESEREKNILAAMVEELPNGVVICNMAHRVILYNRKAKQLLETSRDAVPKPATEKTAAQDRFLGLGRPITTLVDGARLKSAIDDIILDVSRKDSGTATAFVILDHVHRLIQTEMVPVLDDNRAFTGYILIFTDVTERLGSRYRMSRLLARMITRARASLAGIRSASEAMVAFPDMNQARHDQLRTIIYDEAVALSAILDESAAELPAATQSSWPLLPVRLDDLFRALKRRSSDKVHSCSVETAISGDVLWIKADSYLLLTVMGSIIEQAAAQDAVTRIEVSGKCEGRFVHVDLKWQGSPISVNRLEQWLVAPTQTGEALPMSLVQILERHEGELIILKPTPEAPSQTGLRLLLPLLAAPRNAPRQGVAVISGGRPAFYDFDLFHQPGQLPAVDTQPLEALTFTVFDTETTGLNPRGGDEIISIGAVRIVNLKLLRAECFDQLVNPQRQIPWDSIKFHGIRQDMVKDKPTVDQVLTQFHRFAIDTVLVGHNVAFDMRMIQMKEAGTGIYFINPVLDTMLLSAVVHPTHRDHSLGGIAERMGVTIEGRHTAIGDAVTTAKIFLKLIPLLNQQGIRSLVDARRASEKTYFARMTY